jgi:DNA topoisomerase-1
VTVPAKKKTVSARKKTASAKKKSASAGKKVSAGKSAPRSGRSLVIVESPAKARTIEQYLGQGFKVLASLGHVRDLPQKELGVDLASGEFRPKYVALRSKAKTVAALKKAAEGAETIYLATDPDREGEAIAWHVAVALGEKDPAANPRFRRLTFNEITRRAVNEALDHTTGIDWKKVDAQQARRVLDRIVGYQVSPLLWKALYRGLSAGRVQSVALRLICEREAEIEAFRPEEYWTLQARFSSPGASGALVYPGVLDLVDGAKAEVGDEASARTLAEEARRNTYRILSVERKARKRNPPPPFITSTLQQEAARKLGFTAKRTMALAQQLYEGVTVPGEGSVALITYMRTDSVRVSAEALGAARAFIQERWGKRYLPARARRYRSGKGAQDAHEAVRPVDLDRAPETARACLNRDQLRLYQLIWNRFLASQMNPAEYEGTSVLTAGGRLTFRSTGSVLTFDGYLTLYREGSDENGEEEGQLPAGLVEGRPATLEELDTEQHFTKPPARFTEASLVRELEQDGIGRPSTYAQIISVLLERTYVDRAGKSLSPTDLGRRVSRLLVDLFPDIFQVPFTARMEEELDKIESGQDALRDVLKAFYEPFARDLAAASERVGTIKQELQESTDQTCELCGKPMVVKWGRRGRFLACSGWPECKQTRPLPEEEAALNGAVPSGTVCPECGAAMAVKHGRFGRFLACTRYPECKGTRPLLIGVACPECGQPLAEKQSKKGKVFYSCTGYPDCRFALWDRPVARVCPVCEYPILVERTNRTEGEHLYCPKCQAVLRPDAD